MNRTPSKSRTRFNATRIDERTTPSTYYLDHQKSSTRSRTTSRPATPNGLSLLRSLETLARVIFGIMFLFFALKEIGTANSAQNWQAVQGEIIRKKVEIVEGRFRDREKPVISYKYKVNGQVYISDRIQIGGASGGASGDAQKTLDSYPNKIVTVYFNPETPSEATLNRNLNQSSTLLLFYLAGLMVILLKFHKPYSHGAA